jgi:hypothetical protein
MNCDEAFDCLTDPARRDGDELKWHLGLCPRCRQMKDVLSPALDLFAPPDAALDGTAASHPSGDATEFGALSHSVDESGLDLEHASPRPAALPAESILLAERTAADLSRRSRDPRQLRRRFGSATRFVAILLLGAVITLSATTWSNRRDRDRTATTGTPSRSDCLWVHHDREAKANPSRTSKQVVLSCVDCHLSRAFE